jgi:hypothetical protein
MQEARTQSLRQTRGTGCCRSRYNFLETLNERPWEGTGVGKGRTLMR